MGNDMKIRDELLEKIYEIKYRSHNPEQDCECEICRVCNELLVFARGKGENPTEQHDMKCPKLYGEKCNCNPESLN